MDVMSRAKVSSTIVLIVGTDCTSRALFLKQNWIIRATNTRYYSCDDVQTSSVMLVSQMVISSLMFVHNVRYGFISPVHCYQESRVDAIMITHFLCRIVFQMSIADTKFPVISALRTYHLRIGFTIVAFAGTFCILGVWKSTENQVIGRHGIEQPPPDLVRMPTNNFVEIIGHILEKLYRTEITPVAGTMKLGDCGHPLALVTLPDDSERRNTDPACDRCTEPIGGVSPSSCYKCQKCNYFVHSPCAMISSENLLCPLLYDSQSHDLVQVSHQYVWEMLKCKACNLDSNGYFYKCQTLEKLCFDLKCAVLPTKLMHKAHNHHLSVTLGGTNKCSSCGELITSLQYYTCPYCRFHLGYECVTLPESVNHRWDKHTLMLSFPPFSDRPGEFYCEICEEEIHPRRWHYHCKECDQSFHPHCIPKILYRNCKFGGTLEYGKHPHPLEFVREGDYYSKCDSCLELMYGKRVFECSSCRFWICLNCVTKLATSGKVIGPSKICE
ncbi:OLC1v1036937C2 [Oldenlandia corymbosa var. corymbosa]|uniref:OLC1v1036937C2 n=1 Tax=Oldenlandia corymbosa var. corymbosa TaxID=529605 RepID=A0AAV1CYJ7_OLDCO|nr:OLC1v1036937C2 [Oldenlandia corymbosa var. corymbosa]